MSFTLFISVVAAIVRVMCGMVVKEISEGNIEVKIDAMRILGGNYPTQNLDRSTVTALLSDANSIKMKKIEKLQVEVTSEQLCTSILHTVYMGTGK